AGLIAFLRFFGNPLVVILLAASAISIVLGDPVGGTIIIAIVLLSVIVNFYVEFQARHAVEDIRKQVATTAAVLRDGHELELPVAELVPGDIVRLNCGDLAPADSRLLDSKDLHVRESALTGESLPVDKAAKDLPAGQHTIADAGNSVFLGTAVQTGIGTAVIVRTGKDTAFGAIAERLAMRPPETEFGRGIRHFGLMITRVIMLLVLFVLLVNLVLHRPFLESFLFAIALAVGMTPEMMPMIITITLAQGARRMARKKVLVKQLTAIEDFGSIEILCSDKTGTLTEGEIVLDRHVDIQGQDNEEVLRLIYLNSYFEAGIKSPLDDAILKHEHPAIGEYAKVDEIPFDFNRKRLSVVVRRAGEDLLVTKGEEESVLAICGTVIIDGAPQPFDESRRAQAAETFKKLSADGFRVLGVAFRKVEQQAAYAVAAEQDMTLAGFAAFLDPPKEGIPAVLDALNKNGVSVVIMTGDNQYVTQKVAHDVGLATDRIVTGDQLDTMDDAALAYQAEHGAIFARVSPEQKNRVILGLKSRGHVVGYIGDGINDAPSLHTADVGISVMNGVDVAKDAAKIILLEKDLAVLNEGVIEGRRCFANIMKYIIMSTSSNFGNMFSMAAASLFLPFLPMLPTQILLNNFLYDSSQVAVPGDNVDPTLVHKPKRWQIGFIRQFMTIIGPISSLYDFLTFGVLLWLFQAAKNAPLFRTGWFVESLVTQTLVVFVIRTAGNPFKSRPSWRLVTSVVAVSVAGAALPYTPLGGPLGFTPLPLSLLGAITLLAFTYLGVVQAVKTWFYRRHALL
ncbi:MAG TPA: magnesium-translocating P-type ATPase, partial [Bryobacteraceae bacterium]|nr:magnesium-translocating P-type ATPase [Bryobacteraceae bacterium]